MNIRFILPLSFFLILLLNACNDGPSSIGADLLSSEGLVIKSFDTSTDSVTQYSRYFKKVIPLGLSSKVFVGKSDSIEASGLIKFIFSLPDSLKEDINNDSLTVVDAKVTLTRIYQFGDTTASSDFSVHKINSYWTPFDFSIDSLQKLDYDATNVSSEFDLNDTTCVFNLDQTLVKDWLRFAAGDETVTNFGIFLKPSVTSGQIIGYQANTSTASNPEKLQVVIQKAGSYTDTIQAIIVADNSLIDGEIPDVPADDLVLQSGISVNAFLAFDFSSFPKGTIINSAEFILTEDTLMSKKGKPYDNSLRVYFVSDSTKLTFENGSEIRLNHSEGKFTGDISSYVSQWAFREYNYGIIIRPGNQFEGVELFAIKGSNTPDINIRPRIKITYTVKTGL